VNEHLSGKARDELEGLFRPVSRQMMRVERLLKRWLREAPRSVSNPMSHTLGSGGKRLRPGLVLLCSRIGEAEPRDEEACWVAGVSEMIHTASLIHDDVVDEARLRRGHPTVGEKWNPHRALLVGDYWYSWMMHFLVGLAGDWPAAVSVCSEITQAVCEMCDTEAAQQETDRLEMGQEEYVALAGDKTGSLMATCCKVGGWCWDAPKQDRQVLSRFGRALGIAFQIADDLLDIRASEKITGKVRGWDLSQNSPSLPLIWALKLSQGKDRDFLRKVWSGKGAKAKEVERVFRIVEECGALEASQRAAASYAKKARSLLSRWPDSPYRDSLASLTCYAISRDR